MDVELITLAGGCFWCTEAIFQRLKGVKSVLPGYSGGQIDNPTYEQVTAGTTGHAEAIQIKYDPSEISLEKILEIFMATHDPTTLNQQGNDIGPQYRSVIFYHDQNQQQTAQKILTNLAKNYSKPIVTKIEPFINFYPAEDYHKNYFDNHQDAPYCNIIIDPKVKKLLHEFADQVKPEYT